MGQQLWHQPLIISTVDGPTLTSAAAASCLPPHAKIALPNNYWQVGKHWRVKATGRISSVITTPGTARFDIRMGSNVVFDSQAILLDSVAAHTTVGWDLELLLTCRIAGSAAQLFGQGKWTCEDIIGVAATMPKADAVAMLPWNAAPALGTAFDGTAAYQLDMFFTQTVATGSLTVHQFCVDEVG